MSEIASREKESLAHESGVRGLVTAHPLACSSVFASGFWCSQFWCSQHRCSTAGLTDISVCTHTHTHIHTHTHTQHTHTHRAKFRDFALKCFSVENQLYYICTVCIVVCTQTDRHTHTHTHTDADTEKVTDADTDTDTNIGSVPYI
jgi:hypothetical protein